MIILDTNVISELIRPRANADVLQWVSERDATELFVTVLSYAELRLGVDVLPEGKRKTLLAEQIIALFSVDFADRMLPFDAPAAEAYATIAGSSRRAGAPIAMADAMIAGIAAVHGAAVASRDRDLIGCGIPTINPWSVH